MESISPSARTYRWLGCGALAHAAVVFGLGYFAFPIFFQGHWTAPLWVGAVTLWFFWPIILAFHAGRSWLRFALFVFVALLVLSPNLLVYNSVAPRTFGLPWIVSMNPQSIWRYYRAYHAGQTEAKKDVAAGVLVIEESGFLAGGGTSVDILRERFHVEVRALAQCVVDENIIGHEDGYNSIAGPEIDRRIGREKIEAAREEGFQIDAAKRAAALQREKDLARRLTALPVDANLSLKSLSPYTGEHLTISPEMEQELGNFVQAVEQFIIPLVPKDAPAFELHISVHLTRTERPRFETSGSGSMPRSIYDPIYQNIRDLSVPQWTHDDLWVSLTFATREPR